MRTSGKRCFAGLVKSDGFLDAALFFNSGKEETRVPFFTSGIDKLSDHVGIVLNASLTVE